MNYTEFARNYGPLKIFSLNDIRLLEPRFAVLNLTLWSKKNYIKKIRNGWYIFSDIGVTDLDYYLIANRIYSPSYVSLELALNYYGVIPERVVRFTSVTTNKTDTFETSLGIFSYQSIKPVLNFGYRIIENDSQQIKLAELEKAILDFFYLNSSIKDEEDFQAMRFNKEILRESIDEPKMLQYLEVFDNSSLRIRINNLLEYSKHA